MDWDTKDKYFLVVAASKTGGQKTDLPYAKVDGNKVASVLIGKGYKKLNTLTDTNATRENVIEELKRIRNIKENGLVVVYYSGHGAIDPAGRDLWLQLYGQKYFGESQGLSASELVRIARGGSYKGELVVIIDACYSAQGAWTKSLSLDELENTLVFASSSRTQESFPVDVSPTETMSAFTYYLIEGLTQQWEVVDENHDGIILYEDLQTYIAKSLTELLLKSHQPDRSMTPEISGHQAKIWAAFDLAKAQNLTSLLRQHISLKSQLTSQIAKVLQQNTTQAVLPPGVSPQARKLARKVPANADAYTKALQAIAEGRHNDALRLLDEAERNHVGEVTYIYQARANALIYQGRLMEGKVWYENALRINRKENPELMEEAAMAFFMLSDFARAEALIAQALDIRERGPKSDSDLASNLLVLAMVYFIQGRLDKAELTIQRLQGFDPRLLDEEEPGLSLVPRLFLLIIKLYKGDLVAAETIAKEFTAITGDREVRSAIRIIGLVALSILYRDAGRRTDFESVALEFFSGWERSIVEEDMQNLFLFLSFVTGFGIAGENDFFANSLDLASRFENDCKRSVDLIRKRRDDFRMVLPSALSSLALAYSSRGRYAEAEPLLQEALETIETAFGERSFQSLFVHALLGLIYTKQRRYKEAEQSYNLSRITAEEIFGQSGMFVLIGIEGLADLAEMQGKYDDAIRYYERAIRVSDGIWRDGAFSTTNIKNLAEIYQRQKRFSEAETLYRKALIVTERRWGLRHPEVVPALIDLGGCYFIQGKLEQGESTIRRAVTIAETSPTADVEDFAKSLLYLEEVYLAQKQFDKATQVHSSFVAVSKRLSTPRQRDSLAQLLMELGKNYALQERNSEAKRLYQQVLALYENVEENTRSEAAVHIYAIAQFSTSRGDYDEAERLYRRAIKIDEELLGKENIEVAVDLEGLADLYLYMNRYEDAIQLHTRSITIREKSSKEEVGLAISLSRIGLINIYLNKYADAELPITRAMAILEKISETNSSAYSGCLIDLAIVNYATRQAYATAERLLQRSLLIDEHLPQRDPVSVAEDLRLLGNVYRFQRRYGDADRILRRARKVLEKAFGAIHVGIPPVLFNYVLLYRTEGKNQQALWALKEAVQVSHKLSKVDQLRLVSWLKSYASTMRFMKRDAEAIELEAAVEELRRGTNEKSLK